MKMNAILPRRYFSIARGAKILDIEIDDIIHLMNIYHVHPCIILDDVEVYILINVEYLMNDLGINRENAINHVVDKYYFSKLMEYDANQRSSVTNNISWINEVYLYEIQDVVATDENPSSQLHYKMLGEGRINGIWKGLCDLTCLDLFGKDLEIDIIIPTHDNNEGMPPIIGRINTGQKLNKNNFFIIDDDLKFLQTMLIDEKILDKLDMENTQRKILSINDVVGDIHPNTQRSAHRRLEVLQAAMYIREHDQDFKKECIKNNGSYNFSQWADMVKDRTYLFKNAECPIKDKQTITEIITDAFKLPDNRRF